MGGVDRGQTDGRNKETGGREERQMENGAMEGERAGWGAAGRKGGGRGAGEGGADPGNR